MIMGKYCHWLTAASTDSHLQEQSSAMQSQLSLLIEIVFLQPQEFHLYFDQEDQNSVRKYKVETLTKTATGIPLFNCICFCQSLIQYN